MSGSYSPGSDEAVKRGCICPIRDNNMGRGFGDPKNPLFWICKNCPLHGLKTWGIEGK